MVVTRRKWGLRRAKWLKESKYMITEGNQTSGSEHATEYADVEL